MQEACYTCRRRRIQCDRSQIPCRKCEKAGLKCLEKRPIRWVQGVAIRGAMRGRSHQDNRVSSAPVGAIDMALDSLIEGRKRVHGTGQACRATDKHPSVNRR